MNERRRRSTKPEEVRNIEETEKKVKGLPRDLVDISKDRISSETTGELTIDGRHFEHRGKDYEVKLKQEGIMLLQLKPSNNMTLKVGNNHVFIKNDLQRIGLQGQHVNFLMKETIDGRIITTFDYLQGLQTAKVDKGHPEHTIGNLKLTHQADGGLEIKLNTENAEGTEREGKEEIITINGVGKDRDVSYKFEDKHESIRINAEVSGVNKSMQETSEARMEHVMQHFEKMLNSGRVSEAVILGAVKKIISMPHLTVIVPENWPGEVPTSPEVMVGAGA